SSGSQSVIGQERDVEARQAGGDSGNCPASDARDAQVTHQGTLTEWQQLERPVGGPDGLVETRSYRRPRQRAGQSGGMQVVGHPNDPPSTGGAWERLGKKGPDVGRHRVTIATPYRCPWQDTSQLRTPGSRRVGSGVGEFLPAEQPTRRNDGAGGVTSCC